MATDTKSTPQMMSWYLWHFLISAFAAAEPASAFIIIIIIITIIAIIIVISIIICVALASKDPESKK